MECKKICQFLTGYYVYILNMLVFFNFFHKSLNQSMFFLNEFAMLFLVHLDASESSSNASKLPIKQMRCREPIQQKACKATFARSRRPLPKQIPISKSTNTKLHVVKKVKTGMFLLLNLRVCDIKFLKTEYIV